MRSCFRRKKKRMMVARLGGIGDYVLFRNFLPTLQTTFSGELILVGNIVFKDFAEHFDSKIVEKFIWIDPKRYYCDFFYRLRIWISIGQTRADMFVTSDHSRSILSVELALMSGAKNRCAPQSLISEELNYSYDFSPVALDATHHEFERNQFFIQAILDFWGQKSTFLPQKTSIELSKPIIKKENTIALFLGASDPSRCWSAAHWLTMMAQLNEVRPFTFVLLGGKSELDIANQILTNLPPALWVEDLVNQLSLPILTTQIAESQLLVSNDTGAVHIAVAVETPCVCVSNGNHYGRFVPYPASLAANFSVVLPILENGDSLPSRFMHGSDLGIQDIEPQVVTHAVLSYLSKE